MLTACGSKKLKTAYEAVAKDYEANMSTYVKTADDWSYVSVDTNPRDSESYSSMTGWYIVKAMNTALGLPDSVWEEMTKTTALQGRLSETYNNIVVSWTYYPSHGLEVMYKLA
jgi:hypothetical protein